ncbi:MFS transporter [Sinorhizobium sp. 8-89]|uniref:MFS transporter n=1 Tax=Sinorhizobium sp. 7-81 TaxID=3049087 RepID=UPI0024C31F5A|nr:MFS transporter [Sinorhizobium sp. 7-81]MDK1389909.1 MFS transporter [Sinorhizobium sp. 7-81]
MPNLVNIAAEPTDPSRRGRAVSIMYAGVPLGGAVASGVAILGLHGGDWHSIFLVGGIMPLLLAPAIHILLPPLGVVKSEAKSTSGALSRILAPQTLLTTVALWVSFFLGLLVVYLLLNWMPQLLVSRGLAREEASFVQILFNLGGAAGSLVGGRMLDQRNPVMPVALGFAAAPPRSFAHAQPAARTSRAHPHGWSAGGRCYPLRAGNPLRRGASMLSLRNSWHRCRRGGGRRPARFHRLTIAGGFSRRRRQQPV